MAAKNNSTLKTVALIGLGFLGIRYFLSRKASQILIEDPVQDHVKPPEELIIDPVIPLPPVKQEIEPDPNPVSPIEFEDHYIPPTESHQVTVPIKHEIVNPGFTSASKAKQKELKSKTFIDDILEVSPTLTNKLIDVTPKGQEIRFSNKVAQKPLIVVKQKEAQKMEIANKVEQIIHKMPTSGKVSQRAKSFSSKISY